MDNYVLLLDQITPFLESKISEIPKDIQEKISLAGMGEKTEEIIDGVEEFDWVHIEAENKYLLDEEAKEIEEDKGIRKGKGIRSKIKTERYYIWDRLSPLQREYKVARYDFKNCPNHREKAASEKLIESITPYLEKKFSDLPQPMKMHIAYVDIFLKWDEISTGQREYLARDFDARMQPDHENSVNLGFLIEIFDIKNEWHSFAQKKTLLAKEAIPLMNGLDPASWKEYQNKEKELPKDMISSIERCLDIAKDDGFVKGPPSEWLAWGRFHDLDKPTIKSREWLSESNVCMWELFESAVNKHVEKTNKSRDSHNEQESSQANALKIKSIDKRKVMSAFRDIKWDFDHWGKNLASPPNWLEECRVSKGSKRTSALWNPICIGLCLLDKGVSLKELDAVFSSLKDWKDEWREKTQLERD